MNLSSPADVPAELPFRPELPKRRYSVRLHSQQLSMTVMPQEGRSAFEEGASLIFSLWSALSLAIDNEFGGRHSRDKAQQLWVDIVQWFYDGKGNYLACSHPDQLDQSDCAMH